MTHDLTDQAFQTDPHPAYAEWRRTDPVRRIRTPGGTDSWLITRYEDARQALTDPRLSKEVPGAPREGIAAALSRHMLAVDPPDHTRLRRLVSAAFTARRIERLRPRIEQLTDDLLDEMALDAEVDFLDALAFPLPIQVICELLGVPAEDRDSFRRWSTALVTGPAAGIDMQEAHNAIVQYIIGLVADRRSHPGEDLISGLIDVADSEDRLSETELISMVFLLLIAGHETTVNLIGNGTYLLLSDRTRWAALRTDPALLPSAIEEFLRFEGPVETATYRIAAVDLEIAGQPIRAGDIIFISLLAANRDETHFPYADELRLDRPQNTHLAFGHGIHYCIGAPLARLEAQIAFGKLLTRFPELSLAVPPTDLEWRPGLLIRGLQKLPVRPGPAAAKP